MKTTSCVLLRCRPCNACVLLYGVARRESEGVSDVELVGLIDCLSGDDSTDTQIQLSQHRGENSEQHDQGTTALNTTLHHTTVAWNNRG